jgi:L-threonylcarbamoyladenylate synthase
LTNIEYVLPGLKKYDEAIHILQKGGIVAYPTETYYGLAVDPKNKHAVEALYRLKSRKPDKTLSYLIPNKKKLLQHVVHVPAVYNFLIETFWPGPLTLIFYGSEDCLLPCRNEDKSLAFRMSSHPVAQKLCCLWGDAITTSSANISGNPPMSSAGEVNKQWGTQIDYILDGGETPGGTPSTIARCSKSIVEILRSGSVTEQEIRNVLPGSYTICKN